MVTELETKTENVWMQHNNLSDHFIKRKWQKHHGGKNVVVAKTSLGTNVVVELTSFFSYKWHKSRFFRYVWDKSRPCWRWQKRRGGSGKNVARKKRQWEKSRGINLPLNICKIMFLYFNNCLQYITISICFVAKNLHQLSKVSIVYFFSSKGKQKWEI